MEAFFVHIIKSSCLLSIFLLAYYTLLKKETFFASNRLFLIAGLLVSLFLPFISLTRTIYVDAAPVSILELAEVKSIISHTKSIELFDWNRLFTIIYILGGLYFTFKLVLQLRVIRKIKRDSDVIRDDFFYHVQTNNHISPFSFFKYIFYHPRQFSTKELKTIISHEKVHARGLHSMDILLTEIVCILQWFNPVVWLYKIMVKQNLEFLADSKTCGPDQDKRSYQYLMLRHATGNHKIKIVNPFFNSIIKKRIVMLNQNQSQRINLLKLFVVLPFLILFLVGFNTKEVVKFSEESIPLNFEYPTTPTFESPLKQGDILKISSGFGPAKSPFSNKIENHTGIDLVAKPGKDVGASAPGTVKISSKDNNNGNYVVIEHANGYSSKYLHLKDRSVVAGDNVKAGEIIGHVGNTGKSTGTHLHFEILKSGKAINPEGLVPFRVKKESPNSRKTNAAAIKRIELIIDKDTSDEELEDIKKDLKEDGIDFSYTVVHNSKKEIIDISIQVSGKGKNGGTFNNNYNSSDKDNAISPLIILIDPEHNLVSIGTKGTYKPSVISIDSDDDQIWISSNSGKHKEIRIKKENGKKVVIVDGKEVSEEDLDDMEIHMDGSSSVFVHTDSDDDHDVKVISEKGNGFFFIDTEGDKNPLYIVDGKESSSKKVKRLDPDDIQTIDVSKGDAAIKKHGKKAKNGVVEIITKKN